MLEHLDSPSNSPLHTCTSLTTEGEPAEEYNFSSACTSVYHEKNIDIALMAAFSRTLVSFGRALHCGVADRSRWKNKIIRVNVQ
jgi:hypothetical protein